MNVELIEIEPAAAKAKLAAYRKAIAAREHSKAGDRARREWKQIEAGYKASARGLALVELSKAMAMGGRTLQAAINEDPRRERVGFCLLMFDFVEGPSGSFAYAANAQRADVVKLLREAAGKVEAH